MTSRNVSNLSSIFQVKVVENDSCRNICHRPDPSRTKNTKSEKLAALLIGIQVFCDMMPCVLVDICRVPVF